MAYGLAHYERLLREGSNPDHIHGQCLTMRHQILCVQRSNWPECHIGVQAGNSGVWYPSIHSVRQRILLCGRTKRYAEGNIDACRFESEILDRDIQLINSRPYRLQTNGKMKRFHRTLKTEVGRHDSLDNFVTYYNKRRPY